MAEKYIERETVRNTIKAVCEKYNQAYGGNYGGFGEELAKSIDNMPAADVEPVKHGEWKKSGEGEYNCTNCNEIICINADMSPIEDCGLYYCPNCGAKMDG